MESVRIRLSRIWCQQSTVNDWRRITKKLLPITNKLQNHPKKLTRKIWLKIYNFGPIVGEIKRCIVFFFFGYYSEYNSGSGDAEMDVLYYWAKNILWLTLEIGRRVNRLKKTSSTRKYSNHTNKLKLFTDSLRNLLKNIVLFHSVWIKPDVLIIFGKRCIQKIMLISQ